MITPQNPLAAPGTDPNAALFAASGSNPAPPVLRYTAPPAAPTVPAVPATPATPAVPSLLTQDQFTAQRDPTIDENAIRESTRASMQAQIDAINAETTNLVGAENVAGDARVDKVRALNVNSGLSGSNFATTADLTQKDKNATAVKAIQDEQNVKLQAVNAQIDQMARDQIAAKKQEAVGNADAYAAYLDKARTDAQTQFQQLAGAGVDLSTLDPAKKSFLFQAAGYDPQLGELIYNSMKPQAAQIDYKVEKLDNNKLLFYGQDPTTGELKTTQIDGNVPDGYTPVYQDGQLYYKSDTDGSLHPVPMDQSLYTPDYKNYLLDKSEGYTGNFESWQNEDANRKKSTSTTIVNGSGLNPYQQFEATTNLQKSLQSNTTAAQTVTDEFKNMQDIWNRYTSGQSTDLSATGNALIDTFQRVINPNSVVRQTAYANSVDGQSLIEKMNALVTQIQQGGHGVSPSTFQQFIDTAQVFAKNAKASIDQENAQAVATANKFGLDPSLLGNNSQPDSNLSDEDAYQLWLNSQK